MSVEYIGVDLVSAMTASKYKLGFISDSDIFLHVQETVRKYRFEIDLATFNANLIDPIKLTFDAKVYKKQLRDVLEDEIVRQFDKSNTNQIGYFHQNIFKLIGGSSWVVPPSGFDVVNLAKNLYVEIKNKHNTMNSSSAQKTYIRMQNMILKNPIANCLLVEVIAIGSHDKPWKLSLDGTPTFDSRIRKVSMDKFYELVTGDAFAFKRLCDALPLIIDDVVAATALASAKNTVLAELDAIDPDLLKSIYLLSFSRYEGFNAL